MLALEHDMISMLTLFVPALGLRVFPTFELPLSPPDVASAELPSTPLLRRAVLRCDAHGPAVSTLMRNHLVE